MKWQLGDRVCREECNENVWAFLEKKRLQNEARDAEMLKMQKRLCKFEGHLPIQDRDGDTWCELCETQIGQANK